MELDQGAQLSPKRLLDQGREAVHSGEDRVAVVCFTKALAAADHASTHHFRLDALLSRAQALIRLGQYVDAVSDLNKCISQFPGSSRAAGIQHYYRPALCAVFVLILAFSEVYWCRGDAYRLQNIFCRAVHDFDLALREQPRFLEALLSRGRTFFTLKNFSKAFHDFSSALHVDGSCFEAFMMRARCSLSQPNSNASLAVQDLNHALSLSPFDAKVLIERSRARCELGIADGALADYEKAVSLDDSLRDLTLLRTILSLQERCPRQVLKKRKSCGSFSEVELPAPRRQKSSPAALSVGCDSSASNEPASDSGFHGLVGKENFVSVAMHIE